jgi:hypothetical protein
VAGSVEPATHWVSAADKEAEYSDDAPVLEGWNGRHLAQVVALVERVALGERPKHTPFVVR